jgi:ParB-like chromosome segregation protein Spo0J
MDLEFHQLDLRYEELRSRSPDRERRLLASLADIGQQAPIVVVAAENDPRDRFVVVDGYKRVRLLRRLAQDTVQATRWELGEADGLLMERLLRAGDADSPLEQGWFLRELGDRFGLTLEQMAQRFARTPSWVSRRLGLVKDLPVVVQQHVRCGAIGSHVAMKYLLPLARANRRHCEQLSRAIAPLHISSRQMAELYSAYVSGNAKTRELVLEDPALVLRVQQEGQRAHPVERTAAQQLLEDLGLLASVARRAQRRLRDGAAQTLLPPEREEIEGCLRVARAEIERFGQRYEKESADARPEHPSCDPTPA